MGLIAAGIIAARSRFGGFGKDRPLLEAAQLSNRADPPSLNLLNDSIFSSSRIGSRISFFIHLSCVIILRKILYFLDVAPYCKIHL